MWDGKAPVGEDVRRRGWVRAGTGARAARGPDAAAHSVRATFSFW